MVIADASFTIGPSDRIGVIGPNGSGKSTLLRTLAGLHEPAAGAFETVPAAAEIVLMRQTLTDLGARVPDIGVLDWLRAQARVDAAEAELVAAAAEVGSSDAADERYDRALDRFTRIDPARFDERVRSTLAEVGLGDVDEHHRIAALSGGQRTRLQLAALAVVPADVLLLDEPTNDLDVEGLGLLESLLDRRDGATVVVSHDRAFLSSFVTSVLELDGHDHSIRRYEGGYDAWLAERETARRHAVDAHRNWATTRDQLKARAQRERQWSQRGVATAKKRDEPDRNIRQYRIETGEQLAAKASKTERALERHERDRVEKPWEGWELRLEFADAPMAGSEVARLDAAVVDRGAFSLGPVDVVLGAGERVLLTGANGSGKTTLVDALFGALPLSRGTNRVGPGTVVGWMGQGRGDFGAGPLLDAFIAATGSEHAPARSQLAKFGLGAEEISRTAESLSPGELTRARLAVFASRGTNTLVLDEPTNHLDLEAVEQLESALAGFAGTLLLITHDRRMIETLSITRRWHISDGQLTDHPA